MAFWFLILFSAAAAILAFKKSDFYRMWAIVFNVFIAIYIGIMLSPWIISMIPSGTPGLEYQKAACIIAIAILIFGVIQAISVNFITTDSEITFPKLFDSIGASSLGFFGGWFLAAFLLLMISILPFAKKPFMEGLTGKGTDNNLAVTQVVALCDFITAVSIQPPEGKARLVINELIDPKKIDDSEKNEANEPVGSNVENLDNEENI
jgi:magnesium-transporting ATPase (P-type)